MHASVPYGYAEGIENEHLKIGKTDAYAEHARKELMFMIRVRISSLLVCSAFASVLDAYAHRAHKVRSMRIRKSIFLIIFKDCY